MSYLSTSNLFAIIWKKRAVVLFVVLISLVLGLAFEEMKGTSWNTTYTMVVSPDSEKDTANFNYDHYYSLEAIDTLTDSMEEWLKSPALTNQIKSETGANFRSSDWRFFDNSSIAVRKKAPQLIEISYSTKTEKEAKEIENVLGKKSQGYLSSFDKMDNPHFNLTNSSSDTKFIFPNWGFVIILSLLWGTVLGVILVLLLFNLKEQEGGKE